jgi:hypothetical protein
MQFEVAALHKPPLNQNMLLQCALLLTVLPLQAGSGQGTSSPESWLLDGRSIRIAVHMRRGDATMREPKTPYFVNTVRNIIKVCCILVQ